MTRATVNTHDRTSERSRPLDDTGAHLLFRLVSAAYERRALGVASHWRTTPVCCQPTS